MFSVIKNTLSLPFYMSVNSIVQFIVLVTPETHWSLPFSMAVYVILEEKHQTRPSCHFDSCLNPFISTTASHYVIVLVDPALFEIFYLSASIMTL